MSLSSPSTITLLSLAGTSQGDDNVHTLSPRVACLLLLLPVVGVTITRYVMCPWASTRDRGCQLTLNVVPLMRVAATLLGGGGPVVRALHPILQHYIQLTYVNHYVSLHMHNYSRDELVYSETRRVIDTNTLQVW